MRMTTECERGGTWTNGTNAGVGVPAVTSPSGDGMVNPVKLAWARRMDVQLPRAKVGCWYEMAHLCDNGTWCTNIDHVVIATPKAARALDRLLGHRKTKSDGS